MPKKTRAKYPRGRRADVPTFRGVPLEYEENLEQPPAHLLRSPPPDDSHADLVSGGPVSVEPGSLELLDERDLARQDEERRGESLGEPEE